LYEVESSTATNPGETHCTSELIFTNPELQTGVKTAFAHLERRAGYIGVKNLPSPEAFVNAGFDVTRYQAEYEQMKAEGEKPQVNLVMHLPLAPQRTGYKLNYRTMLAEMTADRTIPNNPLQLFADNNKGEGPGLWVNSNIYNETNSQLYQQEIDLIKSEAAQGNCHYAEIDGIIYTLGLISGTDEPQKLNTTYTANQDSHSTISDLLTLGIDHILEGKTPVDEDTYTWAYGTYGNEGSHAANVDWYSGDGRFDVGGRDASASYGRLGSRRRVWG
jgi:hypothetical protein